MSPTSQSPSQTPLRSQHDATSVGQHWSFVRDQLDAAESEEQWEDFQNSLNAALGALNDEAEEMAQTQQWSVLANARHLLSDESFRETSTQRSEGCFKDDKSFIKALSTKSLAIVVSMYQLAKLANRSNTSPCAKLTYDLIEGAVRAKVKSVASDLAKFSFEGLTIKRDRLEERIMQSQGEWVYDHTLYVYSVKPVALQHFVFSGEDEECKEIIERLENIAKSVAEGSFAQTSAKEALEYLESV